jgi:hypothetical protein
MRERTSASHACEGCSPARDAAVASRSPTTGVQGRLSLRQPEPYARHPALLRVWEFARRSGRRSGTSARNRADLGRGRPGSGAIAHGEGERPPPHPGACAQQARSQKAVDCLLKDRGALLTFFDFPAEHWMHLRTSDEIDKRFLRSHAIFSLRGRPRGEERSLGWKLRQVA